MFVKRRPDDKVAEEKLSKFNIYAHQFRRIYKMNEIDVSDLKEMVDMVKDNEADGEIRKFYEKAMMD